MKVLHVITGIDRGLVTLLLGHGYILTPFSTFRSIRKLPSGTYLTISNPAHLGDPNEYWSANSPLWSVLMFQVWLESKTMRCLSHTP